MVLIVFLFNHLLSGIGQFLFLGRFRYLVWLLCYGLTTHLEKDIHWAGMGWRGELKLWG